ncbi:hypothetical protein AM593_04934, partial [Mytilus galloprovincialis]
MVSLVNKIENGNGECIKETTTRPKSKKQPKATNGSSTQRENPAPGGGLQLALDINTVLASAINKTHPEFFSTSQKTRQIQKLFQKFYGTMNIAIGLLTLVVVYVKATPEINHLIETDHQGREIHMDVMHDIEDKTVIAVIGDVSKYKNGIPTVNFHDYNTI